MLTDKAFVAKHLGEAIYGQAEGETVMSDWQLLGPTKDGKPGKVTRLIRLERRNMEGQPRGTFERV